MSKYILHEVVENDLVAIWDYIAKDRPRSADDVVEAAYKTFGILATNPRIGAGGRVRSRKNRDVRMFPVSGYPDYLVFYRVLPDYIQIARVLHGARDYQALFADEPKPE